MILSIIIVGLIISALVYQYIDYKTMVSFYGRANSNDVEKFIRDNFRDAKINRYDPEIIVFPSLAHDLDKIVFIKRTQTSFIFPFQVYGYGVVSRFDEVYKVIQTLYASLDVDGEIRRNKLNEKP
jgi:hypothetical protein